MRGERVSPCSLSMESMDTRAWFLIKNNVVVCGGGVSRRGWINQLEVCGVLAVVCGAIVKKRVTKNRDVG